MNIHFCPVMSCPVACATFVPEYFGQLILDCINRTENAMTQEHAFKAAELCVKAEMRAKLVKSANCRKEGARL